MAAASAALDALALDWQKRVAEQRQLYATKRTDEQFHQFKQKHRGDEDASGEAAQTALRAAQEQRDSHEKEMASIRTAFREEMRLRGPVEYWSAKRKEDATKAWGALVALMLGIAGLAVAGFTFGATQVDNMLATAAQTATKGW